MTISINLGTSWSRIVMMYVMMFVFTLWATGGWVEGSIVMGMILTVALIPKGDD